MPTIISTNELAKEQRKNEELRKLLHSPTALNLKKLRLDDSETTIYCDISNDIRIYVPATLRKKNFDIVHKMSHPGAKATRKLITRRYIWPDINKNVTSWVKTCLQCQRSDTTTHQQDS